MKKCIFNKIKSPITPPLPLPPFSAGDATPLGTMGMKLRLPFREKLFRSLETIDISYTPFAIPSSFARVYGAKSV